MLFTVNHMSLQCVGQNHVFIYYYQKSAVGNVLELMTCYFELKAHWEDLEDIPSSLFGQVETRSYRNIADL